MSEGAGWGLTPGEQNVLDHIAGEYCDQCGATRHVEMIDDQALCRNCRLIEAADSLSGTGGE